LATGPVGEDEANWPVPWRRNLAAVWIAQATGIFGFWFCLPFLPLYLEHDLGVRHGPELAFWSGAVTATAGFGQFVASPFWGALSDRFGRKAMLLRAMLLGSLTVGLMGFARTPLDLTILRFAQGASSGVTAAGTTLVATGTPRSQVGWALGISGSAVAIGAAAGPVVGGLVESAVGPRWVFWIGGGLLLLAVVPVVPLVREFRSNPAPGGAGDDAPRPSDRLPRRVMLAVVLLLVAIAAIQVSYSAALPLVPLLAISVAPGAAGSLTGGAFTAAGIGSVAGAIAYAWPARRFGYRTVVAAAALAGAASMAVLATASAALVIVIAMLATGFFFNAATTAVNAMLGLETPGAHQGRVFGFAASAIAVGYTIGPVLAGVIGATLNVRTGLAAAAACAIGLFALATWGLREPAR
jgi:DHA1 family multidrug resistance protein-like MFS transporter